MDVAIDYSYAMELAVRACTSATSTFVSPVADKLDQESSNPENVELGTVKTERSKKLKKALANIHRDATKEMAGADLDASDAMGALKLAQDILSDICAAAKKSAPGTISRWIFSTVESVMSRYSLEESEPQSS